jgi:hypothetical protein
LLEIPAQLEAVEIGAWIHCNSLCELRFETPSRLKRLDLPRTRFGAISIPDSVEIVRGNVGGLGNQSRVLHFGPESCLNDIDLMEFRCFPFLSRPDMAGNQLFVRLSEKVLRRFRSKIEELDCYPEEDYRDELDMY